MNESGKVKTVLVFGLLAFGVYYLMQPDERLEMLMAIPSSADMMESPGVEEVSYRENDFYFDEIPVNGAVTVVDFYSQACGACRHLEKAYKPFLDLRPDVAIRRVEMPRTWNPSWAKNVLNRDIRSNASYCDHRSRWHADRPR